MNARASIFVALAVTTLTVSGIQVDAWSPPQPREAAVGFCSTATPGSLPNAIRFYADRKWRVLVPVAFESLLVSVPDKTCAGGACQTYVNGFVVID